LIYPLTFCKISLYYIRVHSITDRLNSKERGDKTMKKLLLLAAMFFVWPAVAFADSDGWGHMEGWGNMMNFGWGGVFMWILFLIIIVVVVYFVLQGTRARGHDSSFGETSKETPIDILKRRYARGEISKEEFEQIKRDLKN